MAPRFTPPRRAGLLLIYLLLCAAGRPPEAIAADVEVVVNPALYTSGQIRASLDRYIADLQGQGYTTALTTTAFADARALRSHLAQGYASGGLAGAVLVGDLPNPYFERNGQYGNPNAYQRFPCDLYYMDVDGIWTDNIASANPGTLDTHSGDVSPELWLGRMPVSTLVGLHPGRSEAQLLNDYFAKDHAYRLGFARKPAEGLAYVDDDWAFCADAWAGNVSASVASGVDVVKGGAATTAADYLARLSPAQGAGYESVLLAAHSTSQYHAFKIGGQTTGGYVYNSQLADSDPQALFYNLFCCSGAAYDQPGYMAGEYVFGADSGLLAVGTSKTGGMVEFGAYYDPLAAGETFGEALRDWFGSELRYGSTATMMDWIYGMTLLGDPTLLSQRFVLPAGDLDGDGMIGSGDLDILRGHWGQTATSGDLLSYDLSGDGFVGGADLDIVRSRWGLSILSQSAVPEPSSFLLLASGALAVLLGHRSLRAESSIKESAMGRNG